MAEGNWSVIRVEKISAEGAQKTERHNERKNESYANLNVDGQWQDRNYEPQAGDIIFFDWDGDGTSDHVGIVEKCENGVVYTVEGNSGDACRGRQYSVGSGSILGYGVPAY